MANYPVLGCLIGVSSALFGVTYREAFIVAENLEKVLQNITTAAKGSINEANLAQEMLKNTWFCERVFSSLLIQQLKKPS